jgi:cytochrome c-type biogenesis protein CcmH/NrfF
MSIRSMAAAALMAVVLPSVLAAQIPPGEVEGEAYLPHPEANEAIGQLRSPYCPGLMLEVCPSPDAAILRDSIEMLAQEGWESEDLVEWMIANHGEEWRAIPKTRGTGILAWVLPPAALFMGLGIVAVVLRRIAPPKEKEVSAKVDLSDDDLAKMKDALRELEAEDEPVI